MKSHEFFRRFANLPIGNRYTIIDKIKHGELTMNGLFFQMERLSEKLRPLLIEQQELLDIADEYLPLIENEEKKNSEQI